MDAEQRIAELSRRLAQVVNATSDENQSNTPDMLLGDFLVAVLDAGHRLITKRDLWYGGFRHPAKHRAVPESARGQAGEGKARYLTKEQIAEMPCPFPPEEDYVCGDVGPQTTASTSRAAKLGEVCEHGHLKRQCELCSLTAERDAAVREVELLREECDSRDEMVTDLDKIVQQSARLRDAAVRLAELWSDTARPRRELSDAIRDLCALVGEEAKT